MTLQSPSKQAPWDLRQFSQSPSIAWSYFPKSHQWSEVSYFSKVTLVLGKARSHRTPYLGCRRSESPGWFDVSPENSTQDMMHKRECCHDEAPNSQLPIAVAFWIIRLISAEECSSLTQNLMYIRCSTCSVILNTMTIQYILPQRHLLPTLTSTVKLSLFTHAHSSPFSLAARLHHCCANCSCYTKNGWTLSRQTAAYILVSVSTS